MAIASLWHLEHMPPVAALPKKPHPAAHRSGAAGTLLFSSALAMCDLTAFELGEPSDSADPEPPWSSILEPWVG